MQVRVDVFFPLANNPNFCDAEGNSPLHCLAASDIRGDEFKDDVDSLFAKDNNAFLEMLTTPNNKGKLPFELLNYDIDRNTKLRHLSKYYHKKTVKPVTELINIDYLLKNAYPQENAYVVNNMKIAAEVINQTRALFTESYSHPEINSYPVADQQDLAVRIAVLYKKLDRETYFQVDDDQSLQYLNSMMPVFKQVKVGNCSHYTCAALQILINTYGDDVYARRYRIEGGDHSFIIIDSEYVDDKAGTWNKLPVTIEGKHVLPGEKSSKALPPVWWSSNAVVCDPWAGEVYPVRELPYKLHDHKASREMDYHITNWLSPVNSKFHFFQKAHTENIDDVAQNFYANKSQQKKTK